MGKYRFSKRAEKDLTSIADYTIARFGIEQARRYAQALLQACETIAAHPGIGTDQSRIKPGIRRLVQGVHAIYYRADAEGILIFRIVGPGQDPLMQLD